MALIHPYREEPNKLVKFAYDLNHMVLVPCIAMLIMSTYSDLDSFVNDCVTTLFAECGEFETFGDTHEEVFLDDAENEISHFYINNPIYTFDELLELDNKEKKLAGNSRS